MSDAKPNKRVGAGQRSVSYSNNCNDIHCSHCPRFSLTSFAHGSFLPVCFPRVSLTSFAHGSFLPVRFAAGLTHVVRSDPRSLRPALASCELYAVTYSSYYTIETDSNRPVSSVTVRDE